MIKLKFTNSKTQKYEEFVPNDPNNVKMYVCGPTVYDRPHIGNVRAAVVYDILYRLLLKIYPKVTYARNITDVDDKIIQASKRTGSDIKTITTVMTEYYHKDVEAVGCLPPTIEPRATEHIQEMIDMIKKLISKGHAYVEQGHVLFSVTTYEQYGKFSNKPLDELIAGARVEVAPYKRDPQDFILWKPAEDEEYGSAFPNPWNKAGRPGWHIECAAMTKKHLGEAFDIHGGGIDLIFPHHENEVAQSVCANEDRRFANYWLHNGFLTVNGEKMSKTLNNFYTAKEVMDMGVNGPTLRFCYMMKHYRKPLDFNERTINEAMHSMHRFTQACDMHKLLDSAISAEEFLEQAILEAIADDLNTVKAIAIMHEYTSKAFNGDIESAKRLLAACQFLGLKLKKPQAINISRDLEALVKKRNLARAEKDWVLADSIRKELYNSGYIICDNNNQTSTIYRKITIDI